MDIFLRYLQVFVVGGAICMIGQVLLNLTKMTPARILVSFLLAGVFLETIGVFKYIKEFGGAGATVPICGFGSTLAKGAMEAAREQGLFGALTGGITAATAGLSAAIIIGFLVALIFNSKNKT